MYISVNTQKKKRRVNVTGEFLFLTLTKKMWKNPPFFLRLLSLLVFDEVFHHLFIIIIVIIVNVIIIIIFKSNNVCFA